MSIIALQMKNLTQSLIFSTITTLLSICMLSCSVNRIPLNTAEISYINADLENNIVLQYDKKAIKSNKTNGIYEVLYTCSTNRQTCYTDTISMKVNALQIAQRIVKIMGYKRNHSCMNVSIYNQGKVFTKNEENVRSYCTYSVQININNFQSRVLSTDYVSFNR